MVGVRRWTGDEIAALRDFFGLTQAELAGELRRLSAERGQPAVAHTLTISRWERGTRAPARFYARLLTAYFEQSAAAHGRELSSIIEEAVVKRREFLAAMVGGVAMAADANLKLLPGIASTIADDKADQLTEAVLRYRLLGERSDFEEPETLEHLRRYLIGARIAYQGCRYEEVRVILPRLLAQLDAAERSWHGNDRHAVDALVAEAYHLAASIQLKHGSQGPAWIAADASMHAAKRSADPIVIGSSARIVTHALMDGGFLTEATNLASRAAQNLAASWFTPDGEALSVYGSLLLRGAIAAARRHDGEGAKMLLDEADDTAQRLGFDGNLRWNAFGPTNVGLHRVHAAVVLGDVGTALAEARSVDPRQVPVVERKVSLFVDVARAYVQWGKLDRAYLALRLADEIAPEELRGQPSTRELVKDIWLNSPSGIRRGASELAARVGVSN